MFIKFKKNHEAGISKGQCVKVAQTTGIEFIAEKYAEEISSEEYKSWKEGFLNKQSEDAKLKAEDAAKINAERSASKEVEPEEEEIEEAIYHILTEEDIESFPGESEGLEAGIEILSDKEDALLVGEDDKFIVKGK